MPVRMIASDLDGTLFGADHQLSRRTVAVLRAARTAGVVVVAATGRAPRSAMDRVGRHAVADALVCSNGALIHDPVANSTTDRFPIDRRHLAELVERLEAALEGVSFCWEMANGSTWDPGFHHVAAQHPDLANDEPVGRPDSDADVTKLMVLHPSLRRAELIEAIEPHLPAPLSLGCSGVPFVEVTAVGVHKAHALAVLASRLGIDRSEVVAFGDNLNDIAMLEWAGEGIAMANGVTEAKAVATRVIGHHADDAVAEEIERVLAR